MLPHADNRVPLDRDVKDAWGLPAARITCVRGENEAAMAEDQRHVIQALVDATGFELGEMSRGLAPQAPGASIHEVGTARMGADPKTSYLNRFNQSWEVPNLFVVDGACFSTSGWQNPTLTMMAIALRAARHIAEELKRRNL
jgi:choline dehydrogenase-like flavoprotein